MTDDVRILATGLGFPEGPVAMPDGSVILTEIRNDQLLARDAGRQGAACSPTAAAGRTGWRSGRTARSICCNNGGSRYVEGNSMGVRRRIPTTSSARSSASTPKTGEAKLLYKECNGHKLSAPNDLVFDTQRRLLLHRSRQALCPPSRPWRPLLRAARRLEDHRAGLSDPQPQRLRPVARRQDALRRRHRGRAAVGVRHRGAGRARASRRRISPTAAASSAACPAVAPLRQPRGAGQRQYLRGDADHRLYHRDLAHGRRRARGEDAGHLSDQHLLRRRRTCARPTSRCPTPAGWASCSGRRPG